MTGANRGIGFEICRQLSERGYEVILASRDAEKGERAASDLGVHACRLDVTDERSVRDAAAWIGAAFGRCDALINNAAGVYDAGARAAAADLAEAEKALQINLLGAWRTVLAFLPLLRHSPHPRVVNVSSELGSLASMDGGTPAYRVSKAALNAMTRVLAAELRDEGVLVNAICPGWTATDMGEWRGRPVDEGAASAVWAVTIPDDGPTGGFFRDGRPLPW